MVTAVVLGLRRADAHDRFSVFRFQAKEVLVAGRLSVLAIPAPLSFRSKGRSGNTADSKLVTERQPASADRVLEGLSWQVLPSRDRVQSEVALG